jgi:Mor family transcriptional regulator
MMMRLEDLPGRLREIAERIGLPATIRLVEGWGGTRLYVPEKIEPHHLLAQRLGCEAARQLSRLYAREIIDIPRAVRAAKAIRDREIIERLDAGDSAPALARAHGLTERAIWKIRRRVIDSDPRQIALL